MWKIQKLFEAQAANCRPKERTRESLPKPPAGMAWLQNKDTREWKLVSEDSLHGQDLHEAVTDEKYPATVTTSAAASPSQQHQDDNHVTVIDFEAQSEIFDNPFQHGVVITSLPNSSDHEGESKSEEADWELLSEGHGSSGGLAFVTRNGSISSHSITRGHKKNLSSSTIDSHDHITADLLNLGPSGKGILGVDYLEHIVLPTDTLQGICLAYKVSASRLKRANHFTGETLAVAPKKLVIPISKQAIRQGYLRVQDTDSKEYKLHAIQAELPMLGITEAKAYLELSDWVLKDAIQSAREDFGWETNMVGSQGQNDNNNQQCPQQQQLRAGEIRVMMDLTSHPDDGPLLNFRAQGAGYCNRKTSKEQEEEKTNMEPSDPKLVDPKRAMVEHAAPHHNSYGLEMSSFSK